MSNTKTVMSQAANTLVKPPVNVEDVFSTYLYEGNGSGQIIQNGINLGQSFGSGSVEFEQNSSYLKLPSEIALTGDFTVEAIVWSNSSFTSQNQVLGSDLSGGSNLNTQVYIQNSTNYLGLYDNSSAYFSTSAVPQDQWVHIAITRSGSTVTFYINGTASGTASTSATIAIWAVGALISGPFVLEDYYGYLSNVRVIDGSVVYTGNFTPPTSDLTAVSGTELLTCQGDDPFVDNSSNAFTLTQNGDVAAKSFGPFDGDEAGEGGLVWIKDRTGASNHWLWDTERGATNSLGTNITNANIVRSNGLTAFNSNGFTLGDYVGVNAINYDFASWTFRKAPKFFDVVTFTGDGNDDRVLNHDLGATPGMVIIKRTSSGTVAQGSWFTYHRGFGFGGGLALNSTDSAGYTFASPITAASDTTVTINNPANNGNVNASGATYVAYLFAHNDGDGEFGPDGDADIIKCGSVTVDGNGFAEVDLGFEPQFVLQKVVDDVNAWAIYDAMRGMNVGSDDAYLSSNTANAEDFYNGIDLTATGFNVVNLTANKTYIYIAIRRGTKVPESADEVFEPSIFTGTLTAANPNNRMLEATDLWINVRRDSGTHYVLDRLRGWNYLRSDSTNAEATSLNWSQIDQSTLDPNANWWSVSRSQGDYYFRRAPKFFDVVAYTGDGSFSRLLPHNLAATPELVIIKNRGVAENWVVTSPLLGDNPAGKLANLYLNDTMPSAGGEFFNTNGFTDTTIGLRGWAGVNGSGSTYIAYLFASLDGVSKVGSYTGNGSSQNIDCGFTSGARLVLIKSTSTTGDWLIADTERGIVAGSDPYLELNTTNAEVTSEDWLDPDSSGFVVNEVSGSNANTSGVSYIFYAVA